MECHRTGFVDTDGNVHAPAPATHLVDRGDRGDPLPICAFCAACFAAHADTLPDPDRTAAYDLITTHQPKEHQP